MKAGLRGWLFAAPAALHLLLFALLPILFGVGLAFFDWNLLKGDIRFVGLGNFARIFGDQDFLNSLKNSAVYAGFGVPLGMGLALAFAVLLTGWLKGATFFRTLLYLPSLCSQVAVAMIWISLYLPQKGLLNTLLGWLGLPASTDFLNDPGWAMPALIFMSVWVALGPRMILYVAGLLNIDRSLYEAAKLDGASEGQQFWKVSFPLLAPTHLFVGVTALIGSLQVFTPVYMMTRGGPDGATDVAGYHIYSAAWERFEIGQASAMSVVLFAILLTVTFVQMAASRRSMEDASG